MEVIVQDKLKLLFNKICEPNFVLDSNYGNCLINELSKFDSDRNFVKLHSDLLTTTLNKYASFHTSVKVFFIRLLAIASRNENYFAFKIAHNESQLLVDGFSQTTSMNKSLKEAFVEVALTIVKHDTGSKWLLENDTWKNVLYLCKELQIHEFASELLLKLNNSGDEKRIEEVLNVVLAPVLKRGIDDIKTMTSEEEKEHIQPVVLILLDLLSRTEKVSQKTCIIPILSNNYDIINRLFAILVCMKNEEVAQKLSKLIFWCSVAKIFISKPYSKEVEYLDDDYSETRAVFYSIIQIYINRRSFTMILDFNIGCIEIWHQTWLICPSQAIDNARLEIQFLLTFIAVLPIFDFFKKRAYHIPPSKELTNEILQEFILRKLTFRLGEQTTRSLYAVRDLLNDCDSVAVALESVKRLPSLQNHLNNDQANLIFQTMFYVSTVFDPIDKAGQPKPVNYCDFTPENVMIMTYVMDTFLMLLKSFNINWQESREVICLYTIVWNISTKIPNHSVQFIVTTSNILKVTIKKFLPPNMSLLIELKPGSSVYEIGNFIHAKLHDARWEIRNAGLELLLVCTDLSFVKFPSFQKQILQNNLLDVAATIAVHDPESKVQALALKCLGAATKVNCLWEQLLEKQPSMPDKLIMLLRHNPEGVVRIEAAKVLCEMYKNIKLSSSFNLYLNAHMISSAITDIQEVQLTALKYFNYVNRNSLNEQGMLDGTFPPVTFSKETRKIVTLNQSEIQKRLIKCLENLSSIGILTVLVTLLEEGTDLEILEAAFNISMELMDVLTKYKVFECMSLNDSVESIKETAKIIKNQVEEINKVAEKENLLTGDIKLENDQTKLVTKDVLMENLCENEIKLELVKSEKDKVVEPKLRLNKYVTPSMFMTYMKSKDFKSNIEKKLLKDNIGCILTLIDDIIAKNL